MSQFFISYAHEDKKFVKTLQDKLTLAGRRVWVDTKQISAGGNLSALIESGIRESKALVLVLSRASAKSKYVQFEWPFALGAGVPVIPLKLGDGLLHPRLQQLLFIDVRKSNSARWKELIRALDQFDKRPTFHVPRGATPGLPQLVARFHLDIKGRPQKIEDSDEYSMEVLLRQIPPGTMRVKYEILYEGFRDNPWSNTRPDLSFSDEMSSFGDVPISVRGYARGKRKLVMWSIEDFLSKALRRGHPGVLSGPVRRALETIKRK